jgi:hypothetical protein
MICRYFPGNPELHRHDDMLYAVDRDRLVYNGWRVFEDVGCMYKHLPVGHDGQPITEFQILDLTTRGET